MTKKEMEERIVKLEAQVDLLARLMPQYPNLDNHRLYPPQWPQPSWQPPFQITCGWKRLEPPYRGGVAY
jgi:hypothetical protein